MSEFNRMLCHWLIVGYRYGELPNYLRQMKIKSTENARLSALIDPDCPPNHTVLSDSERLATLRIAQLSK